MTQVNTIATLLHCAPMPVPVEYQKKIVVLATEFVKHYSIPCIKRLNYSIVYNRACNRTIDFLKTEPDFSPETFDKHLNFGTLFYSQRDIDELVKRYKSDPLECFDYILCFFSVKLKNTKKLYTSYITELEPEDVDSTLQLGLFTTLNDYAPEKGNFSFDYLDKQLRSALFNFIADSGLWGLNRNLLPQYRHMCALFSKYNLSMNEIERFLYEVRLTDKEAALEDKLYFDIDPSDKKYSFSSITVNKAINFYHLYIADTSGVTPESVYDKESDTIIDLTSGIWDQSYEDINLKQYIDSTFKTDSQKYIVYHIIETGSTRFTAKDLAFGNVTRYEISKVIAQLVKDFS